MNAKTTYYISLKSASNAACETQVFESPNPLLLQEILDISARIAESWGFSNGSRFVGVTVETYAGTQIGPQQVVEIPLRKAPSLTATLNLTTSVQFHAVLEALQQYIDNSHDAEFLIDDNRLDEFNAKLEAAEAFRDQLDAVLASLADA